MASLALIVALATAAPSPDILPDAPEICAGGSVSLDAGPGFLAYRWSTGDTTRTTLAAPELTRDYRVEVTDQAGGTGSASETVTVHPLPGVTLVASPDRLCSSPLESEVALDAASSDPGEVDWYCTAGTLSAAVGPVTTLLLPAGYSGVVFCTAHLTDALGCTGSDATTIAVRPPPVLWLEVVPGATVCADSAPQSVELRGTSSEPGSFTWSCSHGTLTDPTSASTRLLLPGGMSGSVDCRVHFESTAGCAADMALALFLVPQPVVAAGADVEECPGSLVRLGAEASGLGPLRHAWTPVDGLDDPTLAAPLLLVSASATYTVTVTDLYGCMAADQLQVTALDPTPRPMDNRLRLARAGDDLVHRWLDEPDLAAYTVRDSARPDMAQATPVGTVPEGVGQLVEAGALGRGGDRYYQLEGSVCRP